MNEPSSPSSDGDESDEIPSAVGSKVFLKPNLGRWIFLFYVVGTVASLISGSVALAIVGRQQTDSPWEVAALLLGVWVGFIGGPAFASKKWGTGSLVKDFGLRFEKIDVAIGIGAGVACQIVVAATLYPIFKLHPHLQKVAEHDTKALLPGSGFGRAVLVVGIVVITPIAEELFFRGLLNGWLASRKGVGFSIVVGGIIFGLAHSLNEPVGVPGLVGVGLIFSWVAARKERLGPSIFAHATFNGLSTISLLTGCALFRLWH